MNIHENEQIQGLEEIMRNQLGRRVLEGVNPRVDRLRNVMAEHPQNMLLREGGEHTERPGPVRSGNAIQRLFDKMGVHSLMPRQTRGLLRGRPIPEAWVDAE